MKEMITLQKMEKNKLSLNVFGVLKYVKMEN